MKTLAILIAIFGFQVIAAHADDDSPLPESQQCHAIEELQGKYPDSKFTKFNPGQVTAWLNKFRDPSNAMVVFYSTPYPKDPHFTNVFGYDIKGCFVEGAQLPSDMYEAVVNGGGI